MITKACFLFLLCAPGVVVAKETNSDYFVGFLEANEPKGKDIQKRNIRRDRTLQNNVDMSMIRFSKVRFEEDYKNAEHLPLTAVDFPLSDDKRDIIRDSNGVSVVTNSDIIPRYEGSIVDINDVLPAYGLITGPTYPADGAVYWDDLEHVVDAQLMRQSCGGTMMAKDVWDVPKTWEDFNLNDAAEAVHDEYPGYWQAKHLEGMFGAFGTDFEVDNEIIKKRSKVEFLLGAVMLAEVNTWAVGCVATYNFITKWMYGRPRPEEIAWMIKTEEIGEKDGVPQRLVAKVMALTNFNKMEDFTAYPEGSPRHPSWPAMHSAASNLSMWMSVMFNLTPEQMEEVRRVDYAVSYARTVAGVHYTSDNMDGLNLGQEVIARELPYYLHAVFGSDPGSVERKIEAVRFDWNDYDQAKKTTLPSCPASTPAPYRSSNPSPPSYNTFDCHLRNPCFDEYIKFGSFFPAHNPCQLIECGNYGRCFVRNCGPGKGWNPYVNGCTINNHKCPAGRNFYE